MPPKSDAGACNARVCLVPEQYQGKSIQRLCTPLTELQIVQFGSDSPPFWLVQLNSYSRVRMLRPPSATWIEGFGSWFVADNLVSDGGLYAALPLDPCFLALPLLIPHDLKPETTCPARSLTEFFQEWPHLRKISVWQRSGETFDTWESAAIHRMRSFIEAIPVINTTVVRVKLDACIAWLVAKTLAISSLPQFRRVYSLAAPAASASSPAGSPSAADLQPSDGASVPPLSPRFAAAWPAQGASALDPNRAAFVVASELVSGLLPSLLATRYGAAVHLQGAAKPSGASAPSNSKVSAGGSGGGTGSGSVGVPSGASSGEPTSAAAGDRARSGPATRKPAGKASANAAKLASGAAGCKKLSSFFTKKAPA